MITLWYVKVKIGMNPLSDVPKRYFDEVFARLVEEGLYDEEGNKI